MNVAATYCEHGKQLAQCLGSDACGVKIGGHSVSKI
jgi:hypothetical protein